MMLFSRTKKYVLMHKDIQVARGDYDLSRHEFRKLTAVMKPEHMPVGTHMDSDVDLHRLNHWIRWRGIPDYRVGLDQLMDRLGVEAPTDLLDMEYALSVSDHYWLKPERDGSSYEDLNFFERSFNADGFGKAMFATVRAEAEESALHTPNNTLCGYHRKAWCRGGKLYLLKGGSPWFQQEPVMEWLAALIGERLGMDVVHYETEMYEHQLVCVCENMLDLETDLVPADDVLRDSVREKGEFVLDYYLDILERHGLKDAVKATYDMMLMDYLLMNTDRHNQNFGILADADTGEWLKVAPIFDSGTCLGALKNEDDLAAVEEGFEYKLFHGKAVIEESYIRQVARALKLDFTAIDDVPELLAAKLARHQGLTGIRNRRIEELSAMLSRRIELMKKMTLR